MAGGSANPLRQQMINMMYLVLTALLALNVSADILKAFALVNGGLEGTNASYLNKNQLTMQQFETVYSQDKVKAEKVYNNAKLAREEANKMFNEIQAIKEELAKRADGWANDEKTTVVNDKDLEVATHYFINEKQGVALRDRLNQFAAKMKTYLINEKGEPMPNAVSFKINTEDPPKSKEGTKKSWESYYFEGVPVIAAITEMTKFQNDVRNAQAEVTNHLFKQVGATDVKFDQINAIVRSPTPAVYAGNEYSAEIFLGASSSTQSFTATVNGQNVPVVGGKAIYKARPSTPGENILKVAVTYKNGKGELVTENTETKYQVFTGSATISADKMNMLYIGLENPMSVSVPGFSDAQTVVNFSSGAGAHKTGPGKYILKPDGSNRLIKVSVSAKMPDGTAKSMGQQEYRVRRVPNPEVLFGTKTGGTISRGELMTVSMVNAGLGEGFAFEGLRYTVLGYTFAISPKAGGNSYFENVSGNRIPGSVRAKLQNAKPGDMIVIAQVSVNGPAGKKLLNGTNFTVK